MAVAVVLSYFMSFDNLLLKSLLVLVISFLLYWAGYGISQLIKYIKENRKAKETIEEIPLDKIE